MKKEEIVDLMLKLGELFRDLGSEKEWSGFEIGLTKEEYSDLQSLLSKVHIYNPWFTPESVLYALTSLGEMLDQESLLPFEANYTYATRPKRVAIIMAGNIPMVGFHDVLCVLLSGNTALCKMSSTDKHLLPAFTQVLEKWNPSIAERLQCFIGPVKDMEAVIATGSDNSVSYFDQYFGKYPHIFRKNRTSVAVLNGKESKDELKLLGNDMLRYFGLGCRNVSKLFVPLDFNLDRVFEAIVDFGGIVNHHKFANNYDYNRTIYLMNSVPFLDNNFCLMREDEGLFSPLSVFHIQRYTELEEVTRFIQEHEASIQTIVGHDFQSFGSAQLPSISDFADGIDTMKWLSGLN